jgi:hypothetical protein
MTTATECWQNTGPTCPDTETCESAEDTTLSQLTLFVVDSLARTLALLDNAQDLKANAQDSGMSSPVLLATYDPDTSSWRTSQGCFLRGWEPYSETWPAAGMMQNGRAYRLPRLVPRISGKGCSYLPTIRASDADHGGPNQRDSKGRMGFTAAIRRWPTLRSCSAMAAVITKDAVAKSSESFPNIETVIAREYGEAAIGMGIAPEFCEWYMGFPTGWTDCEDSETP